MKLITVNIYGENKFLIQVTQDIKVLDIKNTLNKWLIKNNLKNTDFKFRMFINNSTEIPIFNTNKYDDSDMKNIWNIMSNPIIIGERNFDINRLKDLNPLVLYQIALDLDLPQLMVLCQSESKFNKAVCLNNRFWGEYKKIPDTLKKSSGKETYKHIIKLQKIMDIFNTNPWKSIINKYDERLLSTYTFSELDNLELLSLDDPLINSIPKELFNLNLKELIISNTKIKTVPKEIEKLSNLFILDLGYNNIDSIPEEIKNLSNLQELILSDNNFIKFPQEVIAIPNLAELDLSDNKITTLPKNIKNFSNLQKLVLENNKIKKIPNIKLYLRELYLLGNNIKTIPKLVKQTVVKIWK